MNEFPRLWNFETADVDNGLSSAGRWTSGFIVKRKPHAALAFIALYICRHVRAEHVDVSDGIKGGVRTHDTLTAWKGVANSSQRAQSGRIALEDLSRNKYKLNNPP